MTNDTNTGKIVSINISNRKGIPKTNVDSVKLIENWGIENDAHAGDWHRQVSLLAIESIIKIQNLGLNVRPGDFAENITTEHVNILQLKVGDKFVIGESELEVTQIGKECHTRCEIYNTTGDCIMPKEGIFARVLKGGIIKVGDRIQIYTSTKSSNH